jgi:uncharacterized FlaG/YvyC family protein
MEINPVHGVSSLPAVEAHAPSSEQMAANRGLVAAVAALNEAEMLGDNNELTFSMDSQTRQPVILIVDKTTKEVLRQVPPDSVLQAAANLG